MNFSSFIVRDDETPEPGVRYPYKMPFDPTRGVDLARSYVTKYVAKPEKVILSNFRTYCTSVLPLKYADAPLTRARGGGAAGLLPEESAAQWFMLEVSGNSLKARSLGGAYAPSPAALSSAQSHRERTEIGSESSAGV